MTTYHSDLINESGNLMLCNDEVHIWHTPLNLSLVRIEGLRQTLSEDEKIRSERFHFERDRRRFIACRGMLRMLLACYLNVEPDNIRFCYGEHGRPAIADTFAMTDIFFNLSHSENIALYALSRSSEVGVDLEQIRDIPEMDLVAERILSKRENIIFRALPEHAKRDAFFKSWTRKESLLKAIGYGLYRPMNEIEVLSDTNECSRTVSYKSNSDVSAQWRIRDLHNSPGFAAAFAVKGYEKQFYLRQLEYLSGDESIQNAVYSRYKVLAN